MTFSCLKHIYRQRLKTTIIWDLPTFLKQKNKEPGNHWLTTIRCYDLVTGSHQTMTLRLVHTKPRPCDWFTPNNDLGIGLHQTMTLRLVHTKP